MSNELALVIGNSSYTSGTLSGVSDAASIGEALSGLGYQVTQVNNANFATFTDQLNSLPGLIANAATVLFYFSGHGLHFGTTNYLVPVDAPQLNLTDLDNQFISFDRIFASLASSNATKIVILEACRDNPLGDPAPGNQPPPISAGFTQPGGTPQTTLIAYAASFGKTSADGGTAVSPYTAALVDSMGEAGLEIGDLLTRVSGQVKASTEGSPVGVQIPVFDSALSGPFYFRDPVYLTGTIGNADDDLLVLLNGAQVMSWGQNGAQPQDIRLNAGDNGLMLKVFNQKTFQGGNSWGEPEGWSYQASFSVKGSNGTELQAFSGSEDPVVRDGPHQGALFTVATATVALDRHSGLVSVSNVQPSVWQADLPPPGAPVITLYHQVVAVYDDSWQTRITWQLQNVGPIRTNVPVTQMRSLRHELTLSITGVANLQAAVTDCLNQPAATQGLANAARLFTSLSDIGSARDALVAAVGPCIGGLVNISLNDNSHWTDWS